MTYHFSAHIPGRGIGIFSDSLVSFRKRNKTWSQLDQNPKTFVLSKFATLSYAGNTELCLRIINTIADCIDESTVCSEITALILEAYNDAILTFGDQEIELILASKSHRSQGHLRLIKYEKKKQGCGLVQLVGKKHYTSGIFLPELESELCVLLTQKVKRTVAMEKEMCSYFNQMQALLPSPKSFVLGMSFGAFLPAIQEFVNKNKLIYNAAKPWTVLLLPEDGQIHYQSSEIIAAS